MADAKYQNLKENHDYLKTARPPGSTPWFPLRSQFAETPISGRENRPMLPVVSGFPLRAGRLARRTKLTTEGEDMQRTIVRIILAVLLLVACGAAPVLADGGPAPLCYPRPCPGGLK